MRGHSRIDGNLGDYCDGSNFQNHSLYSSQRNALQILLYYDEVEVCNPLGTKVKRHKLFEHGQDGIEIASRGQNQILRGTIALVIGDNLASHLLGASSHLLVLFVNVDIVWLLEKTCKKGIHEGMY